MKTFMQTFVAFSLALGIAHAEPFAVATQGDTSVMIHKGKCQLTDAVTNLPNRATWVKGSVERFEGCAGAFGNTIGFYFTDKTMVVIPIDSFQALDVL